jgi:hypothetical protein
MVLVPHATNLHIHVYCDVGCATSYLTWVMCIVTTITMANIYYLMIYTACLSLVTVVHYALFHHDIFIFKGLIMYVITLNTFQYTCCRDHFIKLCNSAHPLNFPRKIITSLSSGLYNVYLKHKYHYVYN